MHKINNASYLQLYKVWSHGFSFSKFNFEEFVNVIHTINVTVSNPNCILYDKISFIALIDELLSKIVQFISKLYYSATQYSQL